MTTTKEICVFFPCHTLEDFPTHLRDEAAAGLLAAWTVPWHPQIIASVGAMPRWYRADTPPVDLSHRVLMIPSAAESRLPSDLTQRLGDATAAHSLKIEKQDGLLERLMALIASVEGEPSAEPLSVPWNTNLTADQLLRVGDFQALGFTALQIQLMTRQLRYSSNLDQVVFGEHAVEAARAWCRGDLAECDRRMQAAFDLLAEERDHYFTSDPHLVELILVASTTVDDLLLASLETDSPVSLLMSAAVAEQIAASRPDIAQRIRERHESGTLSLAGGAPDDAARMEYLSVDEVLPWLVSGLDRTERALGIRPLVFGRASGGIPGDLPPWLLAAGFRGAITTDFYSGLGSQNEPKLLWQSGGAEIEALTAKPLDVTQPQTFLGIGPKLGEAADNGQVAAALFVGWPGARSLYLDAIRRTARFGLALGRFWTLDDFFTKGERPYHGCTISGAASDGSALKNAVAEGQANPLSQVAEAFLHRAQQSVKQTTNAFAQFTSLSTSSGVAENGPGVPPSAMTQEGDARGVLASNLGGGRRSDKAASFHDAALVFNPQCGPLRTTIDLSKGVPAKTPGLFACTFVKGGQRLTVDVPGVGFAYLVGQTSGNTSSSPLQWFKRKKGIATARSLSNEFLDVAIHPDTGSIAAVHCGAQRGNRFSWQLALFDPRQLNKGEDSKRANSKESSSKGTSATAQGYTTMVCRGTSVLHSDPSLGVIETKGNLVLGKQVLGQFRIEYSLARGSRWLDISCEYQLDFSFGDDPWRSYLAGRAAWASDALSLRPLVRNKRQRTGGRQFEAPLGVLVDEGDRQLLVFGFGLPAHRKVSNMRLDTLLAVKGELAGKARLSYGFDLPSPVRSAMHKSVPPVLVPLVKGSEKSQRSWLADINAKSVIVTDWQALAPQQARCRITETSGKPVTTKFQFFRDVLTAKRLSDGSELTIEKGVIPLRLAGHESMEIMFTFQNS